MGISIPERILNARAGTNPALICRVTSGWAVMCDAQFLRGYTILLADPVVSSINDLELRKRAEYLRDMTLIGDALLEVTSAFRINYGILGIPTPTCIPISSRAMRRKMRIPQRLALVLSERTRGCSSI